MVAQNTFWMLRFLYICICVSIEPSSSTHISPRATLSQSERLLDGQTLVSPNQRFELGFFCPSNPCNDVKFLGIWYKDIPVTTVVWVANRKKPLKKSAGGRLLVVEDGGLLIQDSWRRTVWRVHKNSSVNVTKPILELLDSGNLVVKDGDKLSGEYYIWESFDHPCDTLLPGMKLGWDDQSGMHRTITSWKSSNDPSLGEFSFGLDQSVLHSPPQLVLLKNKVRVSRWGPWDGKGFSGTNAFIESELLRPDLTLDDSVSLSYQVVNDSVLLRFIVTPNGSLQFLGWRNGDKEWFLIETLNKDSCDRVSSCGPYEVCYNDNPSCRCLKGFIKGTTHKPQDRCGLECSRGCRREYELNCSNGNDEFLKFKGLKLPDNSTVWPSLRPEECGEACLKDCKCMAYTNINVYGNGSVCVVWLSTLADIRRSPPGGGNDIYIRMSSHARVSKRKKVALLIVILLFSSLFTALLVAVANRSIRRILRKAKERDQERISFEEALRGAEEEDSNFRLFGLHDIAIATNNFSLNNKIGEGGFGIVYKGELPNGDEVAVKRLSECSHQGIREFKNEVTLIAKLQHRNLVKLLGCCIEGNERILVYEYLSNRSLDQTLFDEVRKRLLTWETRFKIIKGVAKGLVYLHDDSRLRIVHRDLKASNILLDREMNPKISDFGLAKIFESETEETTKRVIGTHGYMSPEYIMNGHFSVKSDVYSFGVLALEIVSGKKNWGFHHPDHNLNLLGHAWKLWNEGRPFELMDPILAETVKVDEMLRCIHMGLLCVQQRSDDRPTMSEVVGMQQCETQSSLPEPQEPGFFSGRSIMGLGVTPTGRNDENCTINDVTMTALQGR